jgi:predicted nucleic acid-binding protein
VVKPVILLDSGPLGLLAHVQALPAPLACRNWVTSLTGAGRRVIVPEIVDYEVRRELLRIQSLRAIARLDVVGQQLEYLPLSTPAMRRAAEFWAQARQQGQPTAGDDTIDIDMILVAQALTLGVADVVIASTNVGHLGRFVPAENWQNIAP